jgi:hypothetical protein
MEKEEKKTGAPKSVQDIYNQIRENKKEQKNIRKEYKDALLSANEYEETVEKMKELREKKKQIENITQDRMGSRWDELEMLKAKAVEMEELLTDVAINDLMSGKTVSVKDEFENDYEPVYKISFRKVE